ncbi:hypothetical protein ACFLYU_05625 [Candidatus Dependentiae bacterium]
MMNIDSVKNSKDKKFFEAFDTFGNIQRSKHLREPLSEHDILDLQDKFLSNGFHYITVSDVYCGRSLVSRFLKSLNCYHEVATLSISWPIIEVGTTDVYYELVQGSYTDPIKNSNWNEFFIDQFYYDFIWIEACHELVDNDWFSEFFNNMVQVKIDQHIPVLVISYSK